MQRSDTNVLQHLKLRTEDENVIDGVTVTKELIEELKTQGQNPTWYVEVNWVERTYGPRTDDNATGKEIEPQKENLDAEEEGTAAPEPETLVTVLHERITDLENDKQALREELTIKNDQIKEANERERENNLLMRDLHELMKDMQHRLLPPPQEAASQSQQSEVDPMSKPSVVPNSDPNLDAADIVFEQGLVTPVPETTEKGSPGVPSAAHRRKKSKPSQKKTTSRAAKKKANPKMSPKKSPTIWHTPVSQLFPFRRR